MIDFDSVIYPNILESECDNAKIVKEDENIFRLFVDDEDWMSEDLKNRSSLKEFYIGYQRASGDVLLSGLGFGILPIWLSSKKNVNSILVLEKYKPVIDLFKKNNVDYSKKIKIIEEDINYYTTKKHFDFVYLDHYEYETIEYQIENMQNICKNIPNHLELYSWRIELIYQCMMLDCILDNVVFINKWQEFKKKIKVPTLSNLSNDEIRDSCCLFSNKIFYQNFIKGKNYTNDQGYSL